VDRRRKEYEVLLGRDEVMDEGCPLERNLGELAAAAQVVKLVDIEYCLAAVAKAEVVYRAPRRHPMGVRGEVLHDPGGFQVDDVTRDRALVQWITKIAPECKRVCSVCVGSFLLAEAGILDGRRAATHWMHAALLASRYPEVKVEPDAIFVRDGRVWSSAGVTSGIDLALALIEQDIGRKVSIEVARMLVVYLKRAGGQSQYSALLAAQAQSDSDELGELEQWIAEHLKSDLRVEALAERVHMSPRNFARLYAKSRGRTPAKTVEAIRMDAARRRFEETADRTGTIATDCGFTDEEQMRCAFIRALGVPPREYRARFASTAE
jgi:transcriptional regulator GlxA family with amidase domain